MKKRSKRAKLPGPSTDDLEFVGDASRLQTLSRKFTPDFVHDLELNQQDNQGSTGTRKSPGSKKLAGIKNPYNPFKIRSKSSLKNK